MQLYEGQLERIASALERQCNQSDEMFAYNKKLYADDLARMNANRESDLLRIKREHEDVLQQNEDFKVIIMDLRAMLKAREQQSKESE